MQANRQPKWQLRRAVGQFGHDDGGGVESVKMAWRKGCGFGRDSEGVLDKTRLVSSKRKPYTHTLPSQSQPNAPLSFPSLP